MGINIYKEYIDLLEQLVDFQYKKIPLCAAETYVSPFVKEALSSEFEGKYCMNNKNYDELTDFIGSEYIHKLFELLTLQCKKMFDCDYADARTLSGMNCMSITINSLLEKGNRILLTTNEQGGHPSVSLLLNLAQIEYDEIPYDYDNNDLDYEKTNLLLSKNNYAAIIIAQSDLLTPADISKLNLTNELVIYDATQLFGMIAAKVHKNPLHDYNNIVLIGGTHKTLPGPTSGLILTNNHTIIEKIDKKISPSYLRNVQPNNIAGVLLSLLEQEQFGYLYQNETIKNANVLGSLLENYGFKIAKISDANYSNSHQLFIYTNKNDMDLIYNNARKYGITLNKKEKRLFKGYGIRLGLQEITRYGWDKNDLSLLAKLIYSISIEKSNELNQETIDLIDILSSKKDNKYVFNKNL